MAIQSLTRDEFRALLRCAREKRERDWLMILIAFMHGLRVTELVGGWLAATKERTRVVAGKTTVIAATPRRWYQGLTPENFADGNITVRRLKGSLRTVQPLHRDADPLLDELRGVLEFTLKMPRNQRLFPISRERFWQLMQEHGAAAGLPKHKRHPHVLKHSIATQTIAAAGIENVRQHLGHKSLGSTGAYLRVTDEAASAAVEGALAGLKV